MQRDADVIVVGAAVAGGAVGNALGQMGLKTLIVEKGAERDNSTRGDILHPPTLRFLEGWGVLGPMHEDGSLPITQIAVSHRDLGRLATYDIPPQGEGPAGRSIAVPHDRIEAVLKETAGRWPSVTVEHAAVLGLERDANGRVAGVRVRSRAGERTYHAPLVIGCDGSQSVVRRDLGIAVDRQPYPHDFLYIAARGVTDPTNAMHFNLDDQGVIMVCPRPRQRMRIAISFALGTRGDLLRRPDPALYEYVVGRVPWLEGAEFGRENAYVYPIAKQVAHRFAAPGAALVGDSAHTTHPTGATGMNLAISGAARLAEMVRPVIADGLTSPEALAQLDQALATYDAERRPAAAAAIEQNDRQAHRIWVGDVHKDPWAYARAANPTGGWGVGGAGWGQNPAALTGVGAGSGATGA